MNIGRVTGGPRELAEDHLGFYAFTALKVRLMTYNSFDSLTTIINPEKTSNLLLV
jgi:hypothetical protein